MKSRNRLWWGLAALLGTSSGLVRAADPAPPALDGREIMQRVEDRDDGDRQVSDLEMVLIDRNENRRLRLMRSYSRDVGKDTQSILFFVSPADVKDTGFLTYDYDDPTRDDDQWLYLPALKKSKRIASSDKSGSFMGSDFNYADMTDREVELYDYEVMKEVDVGAQRCWQVKAVPRGREEIDRTGYEQSVYFVRQDNYVVVRAVHWLAKGDRVRYYEVQKLEVIDGIWVPTEMAMVTRRGTQVQHRTLLRSRNVRFNQPLDEQLFSVRQLEKGL
jgi:hypothetical protein